MSLLDELHFQDKAVQTDGTMFTEFAECAAQVQNNTDCMEAENGDTMEEQKHEKRFKVGKLKYKNVYLVVKVT